MQHDVDDEGPYREALAYLLGKLSPEEGQEFEARYLEDQEAFEVLQAAEEDLIEEYLRGEGSPEERLLFEQHYVGRPGSLEKIEFARSLLRCIRLETPDTAGTDSVLSSPASGAERQVGFASKRGRAAVAAAALVLVSGIVAWLAIRVVRLNGRLAAAEQRRAELEKAEQDLRSRLEAEQGSNKTLADELQQVQEQLKALEQREPSASVMSLLLAPTTIRGAGPAREARIGPGVTSLDLLLDVKDSDFELYGATVRQLSDGVIWSGNSLKPAHGLAGKRLKIRLSGAALKPGPYVITLDGKTTSGETRYAGEYSFTVVRP